MNILTGAIVPAEHAQGTTDAGCSITTSATPFESSCRQAGRSGHGVRWHAKSVKMAWAGYTYKDVRGELQSVSMDDANGGMDWDNQNPDLCVATATSDYIGMGTYAYFSGVEECDDGNSVDNDGCSNSCAIGVDGKSF